MELHAIGLKQAYYRGIYSTFLTKMSCGNAQTPSNCKLLLSEKFMFK